jgi:hypothetical protein
VGRAARLVRDVRKNGVAVRVSELNSATCGGAQGVSDTFAAALWGTDLLFGMAEAGVAGVNLHTWTGAWYAPVYFSSTAGTPPATVRPLLYGMLLFDRAVQNGARLLHVTQLRNDPVKVWATRDVAGTVRVVVINKDTRHATTVSVKLARGLGAGRLERLAAPSLDARSGVTFAGQSFERGAFDGRLHGTAWSTRVRPQKRIYSVRLPAAGAALMTVRAHRGG